MNELSEKEKKMDSLRKELAKVAQAAMDNHDSFLMEREKVKLLESKLETSTRLIDRQRERIELLDGFPQLYETSVKDRDEARRERDEAIAQVGELREKAAPVLILLENAGGRPLDISKTLRSVLSRPAPEALKRLREEENAKGYNHAIEIVIRDLQEAASIEGGAEDDPRLNALADFSKILWEDLQERKSVEAAEAKQGKK